MHSNIILKLSNRINNYYKALISSFSIMIHGMEREQFLQYRMALLPASGFQSAQYRTIEIYATPLEHLVFPPKRKEFSKKNSIEELYEQIYWKKGATDKSTGEKTLTLKQFEYRYTPRFIRIAKQLKNNTIYHKYLNFTINIPKNISQKGCRNATFKNKSILLFFEKCFHNLHHMKIELMNWQKKKAKSFCLSMKSTLLSVPAPLPAV